MGRKILETLTESMFYVLMALLRQDYETEDGAQTVPG